MTEFNYNDIIEYIDGTYDENFQEAKHWAYNHNTSYEELIDRREERDGVLYRYWQIGPEPQPYVPTEDELKEQVRAIRNGYLQATDFTQLDDAPFTAEEKQLYGEYRQYLRDYTEGENWWLQNPKTFEEWNHDTMRKH